MKILLTRPICDSIITSKALGKIGFETIIIPFLEIGSVNYQEFKISKSDYIMFTSKNAANFFKFEEQFKNNLVFSVGSETKNILQEKIILCLNIISILCKDKKNSSLYK